MPCHRIGYDKHKIHTAAAQIHTLKEMKTTAKEEKERKEKKRRQKRNEHTHKAQVVLVSFFSEISVV